LNKAELIAQFAAEKKGEDIVLMDMRTLSAICDWFVIISANSSRKVKAISSAIKKKLLKQRIKPLHVEGRENPYWVLLDYEDVVVHVFYKKIRDFYALEQLWSDAPTERFDNRCMLKTSQKE